jgi:hypothetical protein
MPSDYVIDAEHGLVRSRVWGAAADAELFDHQRRLAADPRFNSDFSQLIDSRDVTSTEGLTGSGIESVALRHLYGPRSRRAIVVSRPDTFGIARMFESYREISGGEEAIHVFWNLADALAWLEIPS